MSEAATATPVNSWSTCHPFFKYPMPARFCGSTEEIEIFGVVPGSSVVIKALHSETVVASGTADAVGSLVLRNINPGEYNIVLNDAYGSEWTVQVLRATGSPKIDGRSPASLHLYDGQTLRAGLNYITTRDGTKLAATVRLPFGQTKISGSYPTLIEYSGYNTAAPKSLDTAIICAALNNCKPSDPKLGDPLLPSTSTVLGAVVGPVMNFAVVSVQLRGSACSGGAFDLFGYPSDYDGYDVVETVAAQPWVTGHKVGMIGLSYSGISQLEVAGTRPPHLAAITPLSPTDDLFSTGYPGGIYNDGFAKGWIQERIHDAAPTVAADGADLKVKATATNADTYSGGQNWTRYQIAAEMAASWKAGTGGKSTCLANQVLHGQSQDLAALVGPDLKRDPSLFDRRSPAVWASRIKIPTYLVGSLQDEQTGPQWTNLIGAFPESNKNLYVTMDNGTHIDSVGPLTLSRWLEFLQIFVGGKAPSGPGLIGGIFASRFIPTLISGQAENATALPEPRFTTAPNGAAAAAAFQQNTPRIRVLLDNGGGTLSPGSMNPTGEIASSTWPIADTMGTTNRWTLYGDASMADASACSGGTPPARCGEASSISFQPTPRTGDAKVTLPGASGTGCTTGAFDVQPCYRWTTAPAGSFVSFISDPLPANLVVVGDASVHLQVASSTTDADIQATVSEVRTENLKVDGGTAQDVETEEYVTSGYLRASMRHLGPASTELSPKPTYLSSDQAMLTPSTPVDLTVPLGTIAHLFRKGTRILITISAPGGDRPSWTFDTPGADSTTLSGLGDSSKATFNFRSLSKPKKAVKVPSGKVGDRSNALSNGLPTCSALKDTRYLYGSLRGEPCRLYVPLSFG